MPDKESGQSRIVDAPARDQAAGVMNKKLIVVAGAAGKLGRLVTEALTTDPTARVRALVRDASKLDVANTDRVEVVEIDVATADAAAREHAVRGAWAVVSTLQGGPDVIVDAQLGLLAAAKAAGARRFIPSDYSYDLFGLPEGVNINSDWRRTFATRARAEVTPSFEVVHVLQGIFADAYVLGFLGLLDVERGVVRYWGDGKTPIDWTTWEDTARFIAAAALDERSVPERLHVRGERADVFAFARTWEAVHGKPLAVESLGTLEELAAETGRRLGREPNNMYAWLPLMYARGVFGGQALLGPLHNDRYPHIVAENLAQAMARGAI
jgi:nucleoside-diphosphate-sugar epimerase